MKTTPIDELLISIIDGFDCLGVQLAIEEYHALHGSKPVDFTSSSAKAAIEDMRSALWDFKQKCSAPPRG